MNRRSRLKTNTPLKPMSEQREERLRAEGTLVPGSTFAAAPRALKATAWKPGRPKPALPTRRRKTLVERSGNICEIQLSVCAGRALDVSHRIGTKFGGRHGDAADEHAQLSNVLHSCRPCHRWLHDHPAASKAEGVGWALEEWQDPAQWPVLYRGVLSYLDDFGGIHPYEEVGP